MKKLANFVKRDNKGFTLVEIIVVLAILAILIAVALPSMTGILEDSKGKVLMQDARAALIAYQLKRTDTPAPTVIKKAELMTLIDKDTTAAGEITVAVREEATSTGATTTKVTGLIYGDKAKVDKKVVGITSKGTKDDIAKVYSGSDIAGAVTAATGDMKGTWKTLAD